VCYYWEVYAWKHHKIYQGLLTPIPVPYPTANTLRSAQMVASSNFGNVFSILTASAWLPFQPVDTHLA